MLGVLRERPGVQTLFLDEPVLTGVKRDLLRLVWGVLNLPGWSLWGLWFYNLLKHIYPLVLHDSVHHFDLISKPAGTTEIISMTLLRFIRINIVIRELNNDY